MQGIYDFLDLTAKGGDEAFILHKNSVLRHSVLTRNLFSGMNVFFALM
jgi:hypothetical protein